MRGKRRDSRQDYAGVYYILAIRISVLKGLYHE